MGLTSHFSGANDIFFLLRFFFLDLEYDKDVFDDESENDGSGSGFTIKSGSSAFCPFFEISVDCVFGLSCN